MPAPKEDGGWAKIPLSSAATWLGEIFRLHDVVGLGPGGAFTPRSMGEMLWPRYYSSLMGFWRRLDMVCLIRTVPGLGAGLVAGRLTMSFGEFQTWPGPVVEVSTTMAADLRGNLGAW